MKATTLSSIAATIILAITGGPAFAQRAQEQSAKPPHYSVRNLGTLGGAQGSSAHSINGRGWIAGVANLTGDNEEHAALWRDGVVTDLGTLGGDNSNVDFPVHDDNGVIVGFAQIPLADPLGENFCIFSCTLSGGACNGSNQSCRAFRWQDDLMEPLGTLGGNNSAATGANNRRLIVGVAENNTQDPNCASPQVLDYEAVVWRGRTIHELSPLPGDAIGAALAVNDLDQVVGGSGVCGSGPGIGPILVHAVLWQYKSATDLGNLGGAFNNFATGINNRSQIVGASDLAGDNTGHAFLWQNHAITDLGTLPGDFSSVANDINTHGQVVGNSCDVNFNCRAFLWEKRVIADLNALAGPGSPLYLIAATGINSQGEIAGIGVDLSSGVPFAYLAIPCDGEQVADQGCQTPAQDANSPMQVPGERPKVILPESIREMLRQRQGLRGFRLGR